MRISIFPQQLPASVTSIRASTKPTKKIFLWTILSSDVNHHNAGKEFFLYTLQCKALYFTNRTILQNLKTSSKKNLLTECFIWLGDSRCLVIPCSLDTLLPSFSSCGLGEPFIGLEIRGGSDAFFGIVGCPKPTFCIFFPVSLPTKSPPNPKFRLWKPAVCLLLILSFSCLYSCLCVLGESPASDNFSFLSYTHFDTSQTPELMISSLCFVSSEPISKSYGPSKLLLLPASEVSPPSLLRGKLFW